MWVDEITSWAIKRQKSFFFSFFVIKKKKKDTEKEMNQIKKKVFAKFDTTEALHLDGTIRKGGKGELRLI